MKRSLVVLTAALFTLALQMAAIADEGATPAPPTAEPAAEAQQEQPATIQGNRPESGKTGLSRHNQAMQQQMELRRLRQQTIDKERAGEPAAQQ